MDSIGEQLKHFRKARGLTQEQLGELIGVSGAQVAHVERGKRNLGAVPAGKAVDALHLTDQEASEFFAARNAAGGNPTVRTTTSQAGEPTSPILERVKADLHVAEAWGTDQTWRLPILRDLYTLNEDAFFESQLRQRIREAIISGDVRELQDNWQVVVFDELDAYADNAIQEGYLDQEPEVDDVPMAADTGDTDAEIISLERGPRPDAED